MFPPLLKGLYLLLHHLAHSHTKLCHIPVQSIILTVPNELRHEMIHVQNWKIYASHYNNDSTDLGFELKQAQLNYKQY